jgi:hypothetical protein
VESLNTSMSNEDLYGVPSEQPFLVQFFDPEIAAEDFRGRTLDEIVGFPDQKLESSHD